MLTVAQHDPWRPYDAAKKPVVPEPAAFGILLVLLIFVVVFIHRSGRRPV